MSNFFNKTPYTDFHELNLDWLLERVNNIKDHVKGMQDDIIYLQEHTPDMDDYYDKTETDALLADKANVSDLPDMTDYYDKTETDALLADKADASDLPDMTDYYDKTETDNLLSDKADISSLATVATTGDYTDLINKPTIPAAQVNSDWNANSGVAQILNKPTIPAAQVNSDWNANSGVAEILNKPALATVAISGNFNDLTNKGSWSTPSADGWNYYTDPFGYVHWFRRSTPYTFNFNIAQGSIFLTNVDSWALNTDVSRLTYAEVNCECDDRLVTAQIKNINNSRMTTFYYAQTSGTATVVVNLHLVFRP